MSAIQNLLLYRSRASLFVLAGVLIACALGTPHFRLDASSETLLIEGNKDLENARLVSSRYGGETSLVVTYAPFGELFDEATLQDLRSLRDQLVALENVASVTSLLDVPLLRTPPVPLTNVRDNIKTLDTPGVDVEMARREIASSVLYRNLVVSPDLSATALLVTFNSDRSTENANHTDLERDLSAVRGVLAGHARVAATFVGGVPVLTHDMLLYLRTDIVVFTVLIVVLLAATLHWAFRCARWVLVPLVCCAASGLAMLGLLGWLNWPVTVVSANFLSIQLILTLSLVIHVVFHLEQTRRARPDVSARDQIRLALARAFPPCFFATLTTAIGFSSLLLCEIEPVISLGRMMLLAAGVSLAVTFLVLPPLVALLPPRRQSQSRPTRDWYLTRVLVGVTENHRPLVLCVSAIALLAAVTGLSRLRVENSFVNYFKSDSEIYSGMKFIDDSLGGTIPLDIVLRFPEHGTSSVTPESTDTDGDFDDFALEESQDQDAYWLTHTKLNKIEAVHRYLESLACTGKVLSIVNVAEVGKDVNEGQEMDDLTLSLFMDKLPPSAREFLITPFLAPEHSEARVSIRIKDSQPELKRDAFLKQVATSLNEDLGWDRERYELSGLMVLYNGVLQSLIASQIETLCYTFALLFGTFLLVFRSVVTACVALLPSALSSVGVVGLLGWLGIPLDIMTVTIVAIGTGIAVDDTVHYLHRFREEFQATKCYIEAVRRCHASVGQAMLFTSCAVSLGFSVLGFSNFIPTILFGLLTAIVMWTALVASLTLLPTLVLVTRPFRLAKDSGERPITR